MAGSTGLEPATSGLTVQCANQAAPRAPMRTHLCTTPRRRLSTREPRRAPRPCARSAPRRVAQARGGAFERRRPRALLREAGEEIGDLLARRLVAGEVESRIALEGPVHAEQIRVHGLERALLAHRTDPRQDLHRLGVGVQLTLLVGALP